MIKTKISFWPMAHNLNVLVVSFYIRPSFANSGSAITNNFVKKMYFIK
jgi:hypothetical protein